MLYKTGNKIVTVDETYTVGDFIQDALGLALIFLIIVGLGMAAAAIPMVEVPLVPASAAIPELVQP